MLVTLKRESASDAVEGGGGYDRLDDVPTSNHVTTTNNIHFLRQCRARLLSTHIGISIATA
jgi:ADP-glucose pyrophosphorylase